MKKLISVTLVLMILMCMAGVAFADNGSALSDFASRLKKAAEVGSGETAVQEAVQEEESEALREVKVRMEDSFYEKVRSSVFLKESDYASEANVLLEVKNVSGRTLYPENITIAAYDASGRLIEEQPYASFGPAMVENGASLFVWEWFYGFNAPIADVAYFEVLVESGTNAYVEYAKIDAQAEVEDGYAYALIENTLDTTIFGFEVTTVVENAEGELLNVNNSYVGSDVGVRPGSTLVLREYAEDFMNDSYLNEGVATAYVLYQKD